MLPQENESDVEEPAMRPGGLDLKFCLAEAREAAVLAWSKVAHFYRGTFDIIEKKGEGPATEADILADRVIVQHLQKHFPPQHFGYLSEEHHHGEERLGRRFCWIIDPIDGTKDFIEGGHDFALQVGLAGTVEDGGPAVPLVGVVYQASMGLLYTAMRGGGAWCENLGTGETTRLTVGGECSASRCRLVVTSSEISDRLNGAMRVLEIGEYRQKGSLGLKIVEVACDRADLFLNMGRRKCREWDVCAPHAILNEAGGRLTDLLGEEVTYIHEDIDIVEGLAASNGAVHDEVLARIQGAAELWER